MAVRRPGPQDLQATARQFHFSLPEERLPAFQALVDRFLALYDRLDGLEEPRREPRHPRDGGTPPLLQVFFAGQLIRTVPRHSTKEVVQLRAHRPHRPKQRPITN
jgi:hypothetical protein